MLPSLNPGHISMSGIWKWCLLLVESETPLNPSCFDRGIWLRILLLTLFLKSILKFPSIWYIESCVWTDERERERDLWATQRGTEGELTIGQGSLLSFTNFNTIVGVREPNYGDVCLSLLYVSFQEKQCFWLMGCDTSIIDKWHYCFY